MSPVFWKTYTVKCSFSGRPVTFEGWSHVREPQHEGHPIGIFDSYISALAHHMGLWEEYCEHHRLKGAYG